MRGRDEIDAELRAELERAYYDEDFELQWRLQKFADAISPEEQAAFHDVVIRRMTEEPSIVNVMLCGVVGLPQVVSVLSATLRAQPRSSTLTRSLIRVLGQYGDPSAYVEVAGFLDSDLEGEALSTLSKMDFRRTLFFMYRDSNQPHLLDDCLHIWQERRKKVGLEGLVDDLRVYRDSAKKELRKRTEDILESKQGTYNPFSEAERIQLLAVMD